MCVDYDPSTGVRTRTGDMNVGWDHHTTSVLRNGKVLVTGGDVSNGITSTSELCDTSTGVWTMTTNMLVSRIFHATTAFQDGMVIVTGGYGFTGQFSSSVELFTLWSMWSNWIYTYRPKWRLSETLTKQTTHFLRLSSSSLSWKHFILTMNITCFVLSWILQSLLLN